MAGLRNAGSGDDRGSVLGVLFDHLENRLIMLIAASLLGITGNQIVDEIKPKDDPRPDPWTGSQAMQSHREIYQTIKDLGVEVENVKKDLHAHLIRGEAGFYRISELERRLNDMQRDHAHESR